MNDVDRELVDTRHTTDPTRGLSVSRDEPDKNTKRWVGALAIFGLVALAFDRLILIGYFLMQAAVGFALLWLVTIPVASVARQIVRATCSPKDVDNYLLFGRWGRILLLVAIALLLCYWARQEVIFQYKLDYARWRDQ